MKKLKIWWGWVSYRHPGSAATIAISLMFLILLSPRLFTSSFEKLTTFMVILLIPATLVIVFLTRAGQKMGTASKNWRVAVAEARKMASDPKYKNEVDLLTKLITSGSEKLGEAIKLIEERDEILDRINSKSEKIKEVQEGIENLQYQASDLQSKLSKM